MVGLNIDLNEDAQTHLLSLNIEDIKKFKMEEIYLLNEGELNQLKERIQNRVKRINEIDYSLRRTKDSSKKWRQQNEF